MAKVTFGTSAAEGLLTYDNVRPGQYLLRSDGEVFLVAYSRNIVSLSNPNNTYSGFLPNAYDTLTFRVLRKDEFFTVTI